MVTTSSCCLVEYIISVLLFRLIKSYSRHGHHRIVELLLRSKRFSVNAVDNSHTSPLHLAALAGRVEVIRILLECPDINVVCI